LRFWDSSAVVPLVIRQESSPRAAAWLAEDDEIALWTLTPVEVTSAIRRLVREDSLEEASARVAESRLNELMGVCHVVVDVETVKPIAARVLRIHPLRAFDACQLGAALHWADGLPAGRALHTLDRRLATAAEREGFIVPA
jgi:predicted nucleic acid-binding protein